MTVRKEDRERYAQHAAPESIRVELDHAREAVRWLEALLDHRCRQVTKGEWPPPERTEGER